MRILVDNKLFLGSRSACFLVLKIVIRGLSQNRIAHIFPVLKDITDSRGIPCGRIVIAVASAILGMMLLIIGGRNKNLFRRKCIGNLGHSHTSGNKLEHTPYNLCRLFINMKGLLIPRLPVISKRNGAAATLTVLHPRLEHRPDFIARILGIPFVHDVDEGQEIKFPGFLHCTVIVVADGNKPDLLLRKNDLPIKVHHDMITTKSAKIFTDHGSDDPVIHIIKHLLYSGTFKVHSAKSVIGVMPYLPQPVLLGVLLQILLLV